jgi:hypothetical protein
MMPKGHFKGYRWTTPEARFWKRVHKTEGCWEWMGCRSYSPKYPKSSGHGQIRIDDRAVLVHRFSWELHYGPIPEGLVVCHHCDNPPCVRPDHLFLGTMADNTHDSMSKGRMPMGEAAPNARLTADQVREIRKVCEHRTVSYMELGRRYNVSEATIRAIIRGLNWKQLE